MEKDNIIDLIDGRSYHSCIITTYSYDFHYFEKRMISRLHSKNIKNINIFVDSQILDGLLGKLSGNNVSERRYSLIPVMGLGCFHPKIYMFFGEKSGMIIIGSGNLTACGQGINDEIWGAFRYDTEEKRYENLFGSVISFLSHISEDVRGLNKNKLEWIRKYSPWISGLPTPKLEFEDMGGGDEVCLLTSGNGTDINQNLNKLKLDFQKVKTFTTISPYFDEHGALIESFVKRMPKETTVRIVMDETSGVLPMKMTKELKNRCAFYKWKDCRPNIDKNYSQLHAKIFIFEMQDGTSYCMFGSANASVAAIGISGKVATNYEASFLMKTNKDVIKILGVKLSPSKICLLESIDVIKKTEDNRENLSFYETTLYEIDRSGNRYQVYIKNDINTEKYVLKTFDCWGEECGSYNLENTDICYVGYIHSFLDNGAYEMYGQLWDNDLNVAVSNKQMIHDEYVLHKTNPNPERILIERLISEMNSNPDYLLRKIAESAFFDDIEAMDSKSNANTGSGNHKEKEIYQGKILTVEEYKNLSTVKKNVYLLENSKSSMILDYLNGLYKEKKEQTVDEDTDAEEEEMQSENSDTANYGKSTEIVLCQRLRQSEFDLENKAAKKIFKGYYAHITKEVVKAIEKDEKDYAVSYTELKKFNILLYLIVNYTGKEFVCTDSDGKEHIERIIHLRNYSLDNSLCHLCLDMIESFLTLCLRGFRSYDDEYIEKKMHELRDEAFYHIVFCLYNCKWDPDFDDSDKMILLNAVHYLASSSCDKLLEKRVLIEKMNGIYSSLKYNKIENISVSIANQVSSYKKRYKTLCDNIENKKLTKIEKCKIGDIVLLNTIKTGSTVYRCGFCQIDGIEPGKISYYRCGILSLCSENYLMNNWIKNKDKMYVLPS